jgi:hypothetical protein
VCDKTPLFMVFCYIRVLTNTMEVGIVLIKTPFFGGFRYS